MMPLPGISGGQGGLSFDGGTAESGASGGNVSVGVGGFNIPSYPAAFGYPGSSAAATVQNYAPLLILGAVVLGGVVLLNRKK